MYGKDLAKPNKIRSHPHVYINTICIGNQQQNEPKPYHERSQL